MQRVAPFFLDFVLEPELAPDRVRLRWHQEGIDTLHPFAIVQLAGMPRTAGRESQVLLATQSVTLMNQFEMDDLVRYGHPGRRHASAAAPRLCGLRHCCWWLCGQATEWVMVAE